MSRTKYRAIVEQVLQEYANFLGQDEQVQQELIFDHSHDRYLLVGMSSSLCQRSKLEGKSLFVHNRETI